MKKKWILRVALGVILLVVVGMVVLAFSLGAVVKKAVETLGPEATKVDVRLKSAQVWLVGGKVELEGFFLGNPVGCKTPSAVDVGKVAVAVQPGSLFSSKVIVDKIEVKDALITLEGGMKKNNLTQIQQNLNDYLGSSPAPSSAPATNSAAAPSPAQNSAQKKLQVNDFLISGAKLQINTMLSGGKTITVPIPDIHLTGLGAGPDGITGAELGKQAMDAIMKESTTAFVQNASQLGKEALQDATGVAKDAVKQLDVKKATDKIKGLFQ